MNHRAKSTTLIEIRVIHVLDSGETSYCHVGYLEITILFFTDLAIMDSDA